MLMKSIDSYFFGLNFLFSRSLFAARCFLRIEILYQSRIRHWFSDYCANTCPKNNLGTSTWANTLLRLSMFLWLHFMTKYQGRIEYSQGRMEFFCQPLTWIEKSHIWKQFTHRKSYNNDSWQGRLGCVQRHRKNLLTDKWEVVSPIPRADSYTTFNWSNNLPCKPMRWINIFILSTWRVSSSLTMQLF